MCVFMWIRRWMTTGGVIVTSRNQNTLHCHPNIQEMRQGIWEHIALLGAHTHTLMLTVRQESIINMEWPRESVSDVVWVGGVLMWMDASHILHAATSQLKWWLCAFTLSGGLPVINSVMVWWMRVSLTSFWGGEVLEAFAAGYDDFKFSWEQLWNWQTGCKFSFCFTCMDTYFIMSWLKRHFI